MSSHFSILGLSQQTFKCLKTTMQTLEKGEKYAQSK